MVCAATALFELGCFRPTSVILAEEEGRKEEEGNRNISTRSSTSAVQY
ncbi:hypothetical protein RchiOBHm_Chr5g0025911 [Rosa chinensis]|uniref:Uncharacterized protein n=1 Tax=Rosa chinensis TaxID=74649 RepID=A0A2P6Q8P1_ROSCH|nr:hypothetical protein RchiOBHm_Chr5g0025911 [Rosa chinensis]